MSGYAWVTLATNDSYSLGALVLANSLRKVGTKHDLAVLITPGVTESMREKLAAIFTLVHEVNILDSRDSENLSILARPELGITFTKLHCWRLTQYSKCVFVDADALVVRNCDELFEREELSAAPDVGWPDCFNSGVFVYQPSEETFNSLIKFAVSQGSFDGADQGLLNMYFSDWAHKDISKHLPFIYNMCSTATYSYLPAFKQFGENVRIVHFIGTTKPWLQYFDTMTSIVHPPAGNSHLQPLLQVWWNIFCDNVHPELSSGMEGLAGAFSNMTLGEPRSDQQRVIEDHLRKQNWEEGCIDYLGRDSFDNIIKKIEETLASGPPRQPSPPKVKEDEKVVKKDITTDTESQKEEPTSTADEKPIEACQKIQDPISQLPVQPAATIIANVKEIKTDVPSGADIETKAASAAIVPTTEASNDPPVPIQVAESVLQSEPKETLSVEQKPVIEEALSSVSEQVEETVAAVSETLIEPQNLGSPIDTVPAALNGIDPVLQAKDESVSPSTALLLRNPNTVSIVHDFSPKDQGQQKEESVTPIGQPPLIPTSPTISTESGLTSPQPVSDPTTVVSTVPVVTPTSPTQKTEAFVQISCPVSAPADITQNIEASTIPPVASSTATDESPIRPTRTKEFSIPETPIVTEATPPTSPPVEVGAEKQELGKPISESASPVEESQQPDVESKSSEVKTTCEKSEAVAASPTEIKEEKSLIPDAPKTEQTEETKAESDPVKGSEKAADSGSSVPQAPQLPASAPVPPKRKQKGPEPKKPNGGSGKSK